MRRILAVLAAIALTAGPALAQGHHGARADSSLGMGGMHGQAGMMQMMYGQAGMMPMMQGQGGMMMGLAMGPGMVLRLQEPLDLTDSQVSQLEALRDSVWATMRQHMVQEREEMLTASEQLDSDAPDLDAYEAQLREATDHMVQAYTAMARAAVEARQLLTPEQRDRLALARQMMHQMQPGTMGGGIMNGGMMRGGMMHRGMVHQDGYNGSGG